MSSASHLPPEILEQIFQQIPVGHHGQAAHRSICAVSRSWYASDIQRLYHTPWLNPKNFDAFARTLCPSVNTNIKKTELALFVHKLDMSNLVYSGSKSLTARILGRVKHQVEIFIAPAATFSLLAFSALSKCHRLKILNLEYVIESIDILEFLRTIGRLERLERLYLRVVSLPSRGFSKCLSQDLVNADRPLPPSLRHVTLSGISDKRGSMVLYESIRQSKVDSLAVIVMRAAELNISATISALHLKELSFDIGPRCGSTDWEWCHYTIVPEILLQLPVLEYLSIPLDCLAKLFSPEIRAESSNSLRELRTIIIHASSNVSSWLAFELVETDWDVIIWSLLTGHLQNLEEITVMERTDVETFRAVERECPGRLEELHQALYDKSLERSGLFLEGHEIYVRY